MQTRTRRLLLLVLLASLSVACERGSLELRAIGTLERDRFELVAEAQEPVVEIAVREGQAVQAGDLLVRLDDSRFAAQFARARAVRDRSAARLAELVRGPRVRRLPRHVPT